MGGSMGKTIREWKYVDYQPDIYEYDEEKNARYVLGNNGQKTLICIGINPSWACKDFSDPTMNWLVTMSRREGYDSCIMMNPYPYRCSKPSELPSEFEQELLNSNFEWFDRILEEKKNSDVLVMWGNYIGRNEDFKNAVIVILEKMLKHNKKVFHINDLSKAGNPYHYGYLRRNKKFNDNDYRKKDLDIQGYIDKIKMV